MARLSLQRQTYLALGSLVLFGLALAVWISPWFLLLPAALGLGMITAGTFGICTMTRVLSKLPGNPRHTGDIRSGP